jgi:hypothetical protein
MNPRSGHNDNTAFANVGCTRQFRKRPAEVSLVRQHVKLGVAWWAACAVLAGLCLFIPQASALAATQMCRQYQHLPVANKFGEDFIIRNDNYGGDLECISNSDTRPNFSVTQSSATVSGSEPMAFPYIFAGCSWGLCTQGSGLPARVSALHDPLVTWHTSLRAGGVWDATYDIWFNKTPISTGQATGGELMIWLNAHGHPAPRRHTPIVREDHARWYLRSWITHHDGIKWRLIQFRRVRPVWQVSNLQLDAFIDQAEHQHWIRPQSWMLNVDAGFEIWRGGTGLATNWFRVQVRQPPAL